MTWSSSVLFSFGAVPERLKGPRSVDQKDRRLLEEQLIVHFLPHPSIMLATLPYISEEKYVLVYKTNPYIFPTLET